MARIMPSMQLYKSFAEAGKWNDRRTLDCYGQSLLDILGYGRDRTGHHAQRLIRLALGICPKLGTSLARIWSNSCNFLNSTMSLVLEPVIEPDYRIPIAISPLTWAITRTSTSRFTLIWIFKLPPISFTSFPLILVSPREVRAPFGALIAAPGRPSTWFSLSQCQSEFQKLWFVQMAVRSFSSLSSVSHSSVGHSTLIRSHNSEIWERFDQLNGCLV